LQVIAVYNGQAQTRLGAHIRLPVGLPTGVGSYKVADAAGNAVVAQLLPLSAEDESVRAVYSGSNATTLNWLVFTASTVPAMGYTVFFVTPTQSADEAPLTHISIPKTYRLGAGLRGQVGSITLNNSIIFLTFDSTTGQLASLSNTNNGISVPLTQSFLWYNASVGNSVSGQASGAYIFRLVDEPLPLGHINDVATARLSVQTQLIHSILNPRGAFYYHPDRSRCLRGATGGRQLGFSSECMPHPHALASTFV
jgi:hypothetical protein